MSELVVLVTGATDGIGRQTALELLRRGHRVLVHGRTAEKASVAKEALVREAGQPRAEAVHGDLSSFAQVRALAGQVLDQHPKLDVLLNNAGVFMNERRLSTDGHELTFAVNHLAPFLLTHLLLPALKRSEQGRVVTVSSIAHQRGHLEFDDLDAAKGFDGYAAYAASKLANVLFSNELARRLAGTAVTSNSLHPGVITTKLLMEGFGSTGAGVGEGARTSLKLATDPQLARVSGRYFAAEREAATAPQARDLEAQKRLYALSAKLTACEPLPEP